MASTITCNCPDYQASKVSDPSGEYLSDQIGRDWSASGAGMENNQRYCKHIIRAMLLHGLIKEWSDLAGMLGYNTADFPTPSAAKYQPPSTRPKLNKNPRRGDDFS